jgi:hypothetical protein
LTQEELEKEIKQAFIHGQGNREMMEAGLERDETEDYVRSRMRTLLKQNKNDEEENLRETVNGLDPIHYSFYDLSPDDLAKIFGGNPNNNIDPAGGYGLHSHE